jgi:ketosteroid isomerase-like protein
MNVPFGRLGLIAAACTLLGCQQSPPAFTADDEAHIRAMFEATATNINAGNWTEWSRQFSDNAVLQPPNAKSVRGRTAILAWGQAFPPVEALSLENVEVTGEGNWAYGTSDYVLKVQGAPADSGKQLVVFRRGAGDTWEIPAVSLSSDLPPVPPTPAPSPRRQ